MSRSVFILTGPAFCFLAAVFFFFAMTVGCGERSPQPKLDDMDYAVGIPVAVSSDSGSVTDDVLGPPELGMELDDRLPPQGESSHADDWPSGSSGSTGSLDNRFSLRFNDPVVSNLGESNSAASVSGKATSAFPDQSSAAGISAEPAGFVFPPMGAANSAIDASAEIAAEKGDRLLASEDSPQAVAENELIIDQSDVDALQAGSQAIERLAMRQGERMSQSEGQSLDQPIEGSTEVSEPVQRSPVDLAAAEETFAINAAEKVDSKAAADADSAERDDKMRTDNTPADETPADETPADKAPADEMSPEQIAGQYERWERPALTLVVTGNQHGYIEPCGCTGLDRQKGGVARRYSFLEQLRGKGWSIAPIDVGNQVRRFGAQSEIKLQQTAEALMQMQYKAVGIGPDDAKLGVGPMLAVAAGEESSPFHSANVVLFDESMMPSLRMIEQSSMRVGVTSILDPQSLDGPLAEEITLKPIESSAASALAAMNQGNADFRVLMYFGEEDRAKELVKKVVGFDLLVVSGGYGEPTFQPMTIDGAATQMIVTGNKGMYAGLIGLDFANKSADAAVANSLTMRYARVPLSDELKDAPEMRNLMANYQDQLRQVGLQGLGLLPPIPHSSGDTYVGSATCGKCHTSAMEVWQNSMHALATEHLVKPPAERSDVARHFDPECISCHVTGWNPQQYYPYQSGYLNLEASSHLTGNGCENCHGPGAAHSAAETDGSTVSEAERLSLRKSIQIPLENAREKCMECHDLDNSPDFHEPDAFEDIYWPEVEHYGVD